MDIRFIAQPFDTEENLGDFLDRACGGDFDELHIAVAWAKRSGLGRIKEQLTTFRENGGKVHIILGVSEGGATKEGLELALEHADVAHVFHDPRRTFHPKVYLATGAGHQSLLVGSSNLTAGGLGWNFETSLWVDWQGTEWSEPATAAWEWMEKLRSQAGTCQPLTEELIGQMLASRDLSISSELNARRLPIKGTETPEDNDSTTSGSVRGLFTAMSNGLRALRPLQLTRATPTKSGQPKRQLNSPSPLPPPPTASSQLNDQDSKVLRRWFKQMDHTAAQQKKSSTSKRTGNLRLSQADIPIDHKKYFFETFFADLPWSPKPGNDSELEVFVTFDCHLGDAYYGSQEIRISHNPARISGQGNVPTLLHWGAILSRGLRADNFIGYYTILERTEANDFRLTVSPTVPGSYLL